MSKSAMFAGLGQGLMALGHGAGKAIETLSIEKLRQQNLEKNWARQDVVRAEDRQFKQDSIADQRSFQRGLMVEERDYETSVRKEDRNYQRAVRAEDREFQKDRFAVEDQFKSRQLDQQQDKLVEDAYQFDERIEVDKERVEVWKKQLSDQQIGRIMDFTRREQQEQANQSQEQKEEQYNRVATAIATAEKSIELGGPNANAYMLLKTDEEKKKFMVNLTKQYISRTSNFVEIIDNQEGQ